MKDFVRKKFLHKKFHWKNFVKKNFYEKIFVLKILLDKILYENVFRMKNFVLFLFFSRSDCMYTFLPFFTFILGFIHGLIRMYV